MSDNTNNNGDNHKSNFNNPDNNFNKIKNTNKRKRNVEQSILKPVSKYKEKQEQRDTAYGLIAANRKDKTKMCSNCMNEEQEEKIINTDHVDNLGLILSNMIN